MSLISRLHSGVKSVTYTHFDLLKGPGGSSKYPSSRVSLSGASVTADRALMLSAVFACIKIISEDVASLPFFIYTSRNGSVSLADSHSVYSLLHDSPNPDTTALQFRETMTSHAVLCGSGYAKIERSRNDSRRIIALWTLMPYELLRERDSNNRIVFIRVLPNGSRERLSSDDVFQLQGFGTTGDVGLNILQYARDIIGLGISQQEYASRFFSQSQTPDIVLKHPGGLGPEGVQGIKKAWKEHFQGEDKWFSPGVLQEGTDVVQLRPNNQNSQLMEQRTFQLLEICRLFRMPPHKLAEMGRATWGNLSAQNTQYYNETLRPWLVRWEQSVNMRLLGLDSGYYGEHEIAGMLRGDFQMQTLGFRTMLASGVYSINEVRGYLNLNPVDGGDEHFIQLNQDTVRDMASENHPAGQAEENKP